MKLVVVESPYGSRVDGTRASSYEIERNVRYLQACLRDCLLRGEAPFASHGLYPGTLDDSVPDQRRLGMEAGFVWGAKAQACVVYTDLGITPGMDAGIGRACKAGIPVEVRSLPGWKP